MSAEDVSGFGKWLEERRRALGLTQKEVAHAAACSVSTIRKIESGLRRPSREVAELLVECLEIAPEEREAFLRFAREGSEPRRLPPLPTSARSARAGAAQPISPSPAPATPPPDPEPASNLPALPTSFIGRQEQVDAVVQAMWRVDVRWLTLIGPPGTGKTRLSLQSASKLAGEFRDGVHFVPLGPITDPALVIPAAARVLGVRETPDAPLLESLKQYLRGKNLLLVLDNFEQVVEAAPAFSELLQSAPRLKILATSRVPLSIYGEYEFPVPPMQVPAMHRETSDNGGAGHADLSSIESVQLFVRRAQAVRPTFSLNAENAGAVAEICRVLEGLPLAIELAAARIRHLEPNALLEKLGGQGRLGVLAGETRDLPARQRTLRDAVAWSYDLLDDGERRLFRRLGAFTGGCTPEAAEAVAGSPDEASIDVARLLPALIEKSLMQERARSGGETPSHGPRFWMLETIREYANEQLEASGETEPVMQRLAGYYAALAEEAETQLGGQAQGEWLQRLEGEHDNLRTVLQWTTTTGRSEADSALRLVGALWRFWYRRAHITEGRKWLEQALAAAGDLPHQTPEDPRTLEVRAKVLNGAGAFASIQGDFAVARRRFEESLALRRELGDKQNIANSLINLGTVAQEQGDQETALAFLEESLALGRELGDKRGVAIALNNMGTILKERGELDRARALQEEGLALRAELGDDWGVAMSLNNLGVVAEEQHDYAAARSYLERSLALRESLGDNMGIASCLEELARVAAKSEPESEDIQRGAAVLFGAAEMLRDALNTPLSPAERPLIEQEVARVVEQLGEGAFSEAWSRGRAMSVEEAVRYALGT
jgi:predicted ATPase/Tfp pilus assembly protein PilF/DNA-binding XRE family transcriptional regulator